LYVDTDIVCRGDLSPLLRFDLGEKLIAARIEDYSLEVKNAAERNELDPRTYFNSGVLVLDFNRSDLPALIEEAIRLSEQETARLVFHDQCALNIAFNGRFQPLPERFNFFLRPHRERNGYIEDGILLHYLDKPKPWDIVFSRGYREEWRVWAVMLGTIIPQGLYIDMFAAANQE
jgi:UDP-glucose:(glucosyl)LPS alpha-1,3-glucosyltransferase/UDP-D-galactose:(glucosyl)LPS alpha-1,3-D-galactosyltransferase/UDP-glucose:(galactosyl)LPS alpha-1,2-glucosyltransferase